MIGTVDENMVVETMKPTTEQGRRLSAVKVYKAMLALSILSNLIVGVIIFFWPDSFTSFAGQPEAFPKAWPRHWGMQLWAIDFLYLPGLMDPEQNRWPNWMGIVIRFTFSAFFLSQGDGFTPMGIYDGISGLLLLIAYLPVTRATRLR
jgi:Na+-driven multidrug efflux pump